MWMRVRQWFCGSANYSAALTLKGKPLFLSFWIGLLIKVFALFKTFWLFISRTDKFTTFQSVLKHVFWSGYVFKSFQFFIFVINPLSLLQIAGLSKYYQNKNKTKQISLKLHDWILSPLINFSRMFLFRSIDNYYDHRGLCESGIWRWETTNLRYFKVGYTLICHKVFWFGSSCFAV